MSLREEVEPVKVKLDSVPVEVYAELDYLFEHAQYRVLIETERVCQGLAGNACTACMDSTERLRGLPDKTACMPTSYGSDCRTLRRSRWGRLLCETQWSSSLLIPGSIPTVQPRREKVKNVRSFFGSQ